MNEILYELSRKHGGVIATGVNEYVCALLTNDLYGDYDNPSEMVKMRETYRPNEKFEFDNFMDKLVIEPTFNGATVILLKMRSSGSGADTGMIVRLGNFDSMKEAQIFVDGFNLGHKKELKRRPMHPDALMFVAGSGKK